MFVGPAHELMQGEWYFVRMRCTPNNDALELECIVGNGADFHQLGFDDLRVSHGNFSIAQFFVLRGCFVMRPVREWPSDAVEHLQANKPGRRCATSRTASSIIAGQARHPPQL